MYKLYFKYTLKLIIIVTVDKMLKIYYAFRCLKNKLRFILVVLCKFSAFVSASVLNLFLNLFLYIKSESYTRKMTF